MSSPYGDAPEVAPSVVAPEVYHPEGKQLDDSQSHLKPEEHLYPGQAYNLSSVGSPYENAPQYQSGFYNVQEQKKRGLACGLSANVLAVIIAILAIAVIGLAAGTGVAMNKYNDANAKYQEAIDNYNAVNIRYKALNDTTSFSYLTNGCSDQDLNTTGTSYTTQNPANRTAYTVRCNSNLVAGPIYSLFATNFNSCIEACSIWNTDLATTLNQSCSAVNYVPDWTNITAAWHAGNGAPGNCYLKGAGVISSDAPDAQTHSAWIS